MSDHRRRDTGRLVERTRREAGLSQEALARRLGITPGRLAEIENGRAGARGRTGRALNDWLIESDYEEDENQ